MTEALRAYADGTGSEHAALMAVAAARLLVPIVAVLTAADDQGAEKESEMALPTLIGNDGRRAVIAFTGTQTLRRWKQDARPVPVPAPRVWAAAATEADAVVIDVAGPVPMVVEGARLRALANGEPPPLPHEDPDVRAEVAAVTPDFTLASGGPDADLAVTLTTANMEHARQIALRLSARFRRGIEIRASLSRTNAADSPPSAPLQPPAHPPSQPQARPARRLPGSSPDDAGRSGADRAGGSVPASLVLAAPCGPSSRAGHSSHRVHARRQAANLHDRENVFCDVNSSPYKYESSS